MKYYTLAAPIVWDFVAGSFNSTVGLGITEIKAQQQFSNIDYLGDKLCELRSILQMVNDNKNFIPQDKSEKNSTGICQASFLPFYNKIAKSHQQYRETPDLLRHKLQFLNSKFSYMPDAIRNKLIAATSLKKLAKLFDNDIINEYYECEVQWNENTR